MVSNADALDGRCRFCSWASAVKVGWPYNRHAGQGVGPSKGPVPGGAGPPPGADPQRRDGRPRGVQRVEGHDVLEDAPRRGPILRLVAEQQPHGAAERERRGLAEEARAARDGQCEGSPPRLDGPPQLREPPLAAGRHAGGGHGSATASGGRRLEEADCSGDLGHIPKKLHYRGKATLISPRMPLNGRTGRFPVHGGSRHGGR